MNLNVPFLIKFNTDLLVGIVIKKDPAKNAPLVVAVGNAVIAGIQTGDATGVMAALEQVIGDPSNDPATVAEIQTVMAYVGDKAVGLQKLIDGTITAGLVSQLLTAAATEAVILATQYLPKATAPTPSAA